MNIVTAASTAEWQFWIDVGGTFTDCLACSPTGTWARRKVLSSGVVPGRVSAWSALALVDDPQRASDLPHIWQGYGCRLRDAHGSLLRETAVRDSDGSRLWLADRLPRAEALTTYELFSDEEAPSIAIRNLLGIGRNEPLPSVRVRLGTTRGTNALLTRSGAPTALAVTCGFADLPEIGYQNRPRLFDLAIRKMRPLHTNVFEVSARMDAAGRILAPLDEQAARACLLRLRRSGMQSLAVCLMRACVNPEHELALERVARSVGFSNSNISLSHRAAPIRKYVPRLGTTTVDAYLNPVLIDYLQKLRGTLGTQGEERLRVMTSSGGLVSSSHFSGKESILSGPAGGVVAYARVAESAGFRRAIGFDMGGTSTDVSRYDGRFEREFETEKAGVRIVAPMLAIETVAAGGGSICHFDGVKLGVGPDSAGALPGPACYGNGGPCTITDVNLLVGRIASEHFAFPLDTEAARHSAEALRSAVREQTERDYTLPELCTGFLRVANTHMAQAIRAVSLAKGVHPADYVLVAFGGAAPQHACALARELGMRQILIPADAGILSALGMGLAPVTRYVSRTAHVPCDVASTSRLERIWEEVANEGKTQVTAEGVAPAHITTHYWCTLRYQGLDAQLLIERPPDSEYRGAFERLHRARFGYLHPARDVEVTMLHVEVVGHADAALAPARAVPTRLTPDPIDQASVYFDGRAAATPVFDRRRLAPGHHISGPALIVEPHSVLVLEPDWHADMLEAGHIQLTDQHAAAQVEHVASGGDPIMLEVFNRHFVAIAEQMGVTLRNIAISVNVKDRLDFSCALFDAEGQLVVNAPHVPVHLGAMGETVKHVISAFPQLLPGDVIVTNDPYHGGSHLPDLTVVTPVHGAQGQILFFAANRAHHAEIGGVTPGSMPPFSRNLAEEGVCIPAMKLIDGGSERWNELELLLKSGPYPSRSPEINLADLAAQVAANRQGGNDLAQLIDRYGQTIVLGYMKDIQNAAAEKSRQSLHKIAVGVHRFSDALDDGSVIQVALERRGDRLVVDFAGSGPVNAGNLNANRAICTAAVLYVLRRLIDEDIPLNAGVLRPVELRIPPGILNPPPGPTPQDSPAVAGGNVETSQRIVDVLLGALQLAAASQGTMNNLLFGDQLFGYYETVCGGAGATADHPGAHAVHTHMTNTRLTDPEVLETQYPVRLRQFGLRRGSGGAGIQHGGDGAVREMEFLRSVTVSLLTQRRTKSPYGLHGGLPGQPGRNVWIRAGGRPEELPSLAQFVADPGDVLRIETPGGGGWGTPAM